MTSACLLNFQFMNYIDQAPVFPALFDEDSFKQFLEVNFMGRL